MNKPPQLVISLARMHHILNMKKLRKLKQKAESAQISGLVKTGKPGVLVVEGGKQSVSLFLEGARGLRYLDFHHIDTQVLLAGSEMHFAGSGMGLREVKDMRALIDAMDLIGRKDWFRRAMGMN